MTKRMGAYSLIKSICYQNLIERGCVYLLIQFRHHNVRDRYIVGFLCRGEFLVMDLSITIIKCIFTRIRSWVVNLLVGYEKFQFCSYINTTGSNVSF